METEKLCIKCKERPIKVKKWRRCTRCYQIYRRRIGLKGPISKKERTVAWPSEIDFIRAYFTHNNWQYHPAFFRLNGGGYQPDFYDGETNTFIEVAGTRQAFHNNKEKYIIFMQTYPKINFEIRYSDGELLSDMVFHEKMEDRK